VGRPRGAVQAEAVADFDLRQAWKGRAANGRPARLDFQAFSSRVSHYARPIMRGQLGVTRNQPLSYGRPTSRLSPPPPRSAPPFLECSSSLSQTAPPSTSLFPHESPAPVLSHVLSCA